MITDIKIGEYYKLSFNKDNWPDLTMYVVISGITNKDAMGNISEYNIKEELFQNYELGLNTYLQTTNCDILIVNEILDLETQEVDIENRILIPVLMVDYEASEKLVTYNKISFTISGIKRRFKSDLDEKEYITEARQDLSNHLNLLDNFAGELLEINFTSENHLIEEYDILKDEKTRADRLLAYKETINLETLNRENTMRTALTMQEKYTEELSKMYIKEEELKQAQEKNNEFYKELTEYMAVNDKYSQILREAVILIKSEADKYGIPVIDYDQFIQNARDNVNGSSTIVSGDKVEQTQTPSVEEEKEEQTLEQESQNTEIKDSEEKKE